MSKIGLVLGSGAARGLAHIGVLKALGEENIAVDVIAGSSMGALVGACFAREAKITELEEVVLKTDWKQLLRLSDPNLAFMLKGFIHGRKVEELLKVIIGDVEFKDLKIPLAVAATDINTGEEVIIKEGSVAEAVRASISIPVIFMPVKIGNRFLMDGGIVNPVPVNAAKDMGAEFVIACNVILKPQERKYSGSMKKQKPPLTVPKVKIKTEALSELNIKINKLLQENKAKIQDFQKFIKSKVHKNIPGIDPNTPGIFDTILGAIYAMEYEIAQIKIKEADVIITPDTAGIAALEFYRGEEVISKGYEAVKNVLPHIQKLMSGDFR